MSELIDFTALSAVLEELAVEVRNTYQDKLILHDRIASGDLLNSVECEVVVDDSGYAVTLRLEDYWKYVEEGVQGDRNPNSPYKNPGWKAFPHIMNWIDVKPVIPRPLDNGKLPTQKQLAYLITRSIKEHGTQGSHDLAEAKGEIIPKYRERIAAALGRDMAAYIRKVVAPMQ